IYKDFWIHWRDLEANAQFSLPVDIGSAAAAAPACAQAQDRLLFDGDAALGLPAPRTVEGRPLLTSRDWNGIGNAYAAVSGAIRGCSASGGGDAAPSGAA